MNDNERVELNELCGRLADGILDEAGQNRLSELLRGSEEARRFYVRSASLSASLFHYAAERQSEPAGSFRPVPPRRAAWPWWAAVCTAGVAAVLALVFATGNPPASSDEPTETVAHLSGAKNCRWSGTSPQAGEELLSGQRLELGAGFAEVTFNSGAVVTLEGPATLDLRSAWEAELVTGTARARVPEEAVGFRLANSDVEVLDLGTEFTMCADTVGTEVFVHEGSVEVQPRRGAVPEPRSILREKQARRFARQGGGEVGDREAKFVRFSQRQELDRQPRPLDLLRWNFEAKSAQVLETLGNTTWGEGRWGRSLALDGSTTVRLENPSARPLRTVAMWVRLPPQTGSGGGLGTFPLGRPGVSSAELSTNFRPGDGTPDALRLQFEGVTLVGSTPLRDNRWHHVAVVFGGARDKPGKLSAWIYVDGRLESPSGRRSRKHIPYPVEKSETQFLLGATSRDGARLVGQVDELICADRPLSPKEIRVLMKTNELPAAGQPLFD